MGGSRSSARSYGGAFENVDQRVRTRPPGRAGPAAHGYKPSDPFGSSSTRLLLAPRDKALDAFFILDDPLLPEMAGSIRALSVLLLRVPDLVKRLLTVEFDTDLGRLCSLSNFPVRCEGVSATIVETGRDREKAALR